ncbi:MAG: type II CRISPR RNA-guided endonuclease Cas9 [Bacteroidales bacterium]|nr:type II CRISPR RNA-guided endonuclease Cas9 [Bacteroidales bacterium]
MKKILGLDLGVNSIGWAVVNEAETETEKSSITKVGVRGNLLSSDEVKNFNDGKSITTNADRTLKRSMRRNLQRYKLRRAELLRILKDNDIITDSSLLSENGNFTTFETYRLRAKAVTERISLEQFARVLLMINKKRGYKSSRKAKGDEDGNLIDGMAVAKMLYDENLTPGQLCLRLMQQGRKRMPDFYRSDLQNELNRIWAYQREFYPDSLTDEAKEEIHGRNKSQTWAILAKYFVWRDDVSVWDSDNAVSRVETVEKRIVGVKRQTKRDAQKLENYQWRAEALVKQMDLERLAVVFQEINGEISSSSGYLGAISDRSKMLFFNRQTVGQYLLSKIDADPHCSLKNIVFYRQDYLDEFEKIWETQARYHSVLTDELKRYIRDVVIFYQRRLKSQKSLIGFCEFEQCRREVIKDGKTKTITIGSRVIPRSSPLFQEFKVWQILNNVEVTDKTEKSKFQLSQEEKELLAEELSVRESMKKGEVLKMLFEDPKKYDLNFKELDGNKTSAQFYQAYSQILEDSGHLPLNFNLPASDIKATVKTIFESLGWNIDVLEFDASRPLDGQAFYRLWHLLYSFEGDNTVTGDGQLKDKIAEIMGFDRDFAQHLVKIKMMDDYGSLSAKAIRKILPFLKDGNRYDVACLYAGYRHSAASETKEEIENKALKDKLEILPRNSLRNPVVEKILNQMVNVVNGVIDTYDRPDEIRVELARELKKNAKERENLTKSLESATKEQNRIRDILQTEFQLAHVSKNDIIRYRLYEELKDNGYKTLYSNTYISKEELFSKNFDIEHIIPQARLFDDSFSNKTLELRSENLEKGKQTAADFVLMKYGEDGLIRYKQTCEKLFSDQKAKLRKLLMTESEIPSDFIERDLRNTQYIAKKAQEMLREVSRRVVATTGQITAQLREDWQLVDVMKELNWDKYEALGMVEYHCNRDGKMIGRIKDWSKRNDHRHHAMDALTIAFTKDVFIQYFNNKNAAENLNSNEFAIRNKYFREGKAVPPMPLNEFRAAAKAHLQGVLVSIKAKSKVVTNNFNHTPLKNGERVSFKTPRGQLHLETVYGSHKEFEVSEEKIGSAFNEAKIRTVCRKAYREALMRRLDQFGGDAKKAFTGRNALAKNPVWINQEKGIAVPSKVKVAVQKVVYTIRKPITDDLKIDKVVDKRIQRILRERVERYGSAKKAFANLDEDPIWLNKEKGIKLKRVTIYGISKAQAIHDKRDKSGHLILDEYGRKIPVDFVNTGNNHHVAVYRRPVLDNDGEPVYDERGEVLYEMCENVVSFYEAVERAGQGLPIIDKTRYQDEGWEFLFSMKQNEYFVFPNAATGFDPAEVDLLDPNNYAEISPNLFRVQKFSIDAKGGKQYIFRHHLETQVADESDVLRNITWKRIQSSKGLKGMIKVRINHLGEIVTVGEY